jgi:hypothetical protein
VCREAEKYWELFSELGRKAYSPHLQGELPGIRLIDFEVQLREAGQSFQQHLSYCDGCMEIHKRYPYNPVTAMIITGNRYVRNHLGGNEHGFWAEEELLNNFLTNAATRHHFALRHATDFEDEICGIDFWAMNFCGRDSIPVQTTLDKKIVLQKAAQASRQRTVVVWLNCHTLAAAAKSGYAARETEKVVDQFRRWLRVGLQNGRELVTPQDCIRMEALHMAGFRA